MPRVGPGATDTDIKIIADLLRRVRRLEKRQGGSLASLSDVDLTAPLVDGDELTYTAADDIWKAV
ncbi:MAG: hypothetical protein JO222_09255, partial [Frankiales bacterium]|nr:hypothetical protein [Frankiales bacterium]